jgi:hypothetical protein
VERDKPKKSESVGQTLPQLPWKQKRQGFKKKLDSLAAILYLDYYGNGRHFDFLQPPKAATHYGGHSYKFS